jgi:hypothetical protein
MKRLLLLGSVSICVLLLLRAESAAQWVQTNGPCGGSVNCFAVTGPNLFAGTEGGGVYLSTDNGTSWTAVNTGLTTTTVLALAVSGTSLFAGTYHGVFRSTNNGTSWTLVNTGMKPSFVLSLAVSGPYLFAGTSGGGDGTSGGGVYVSTDNGTSWSEASAGLGGTDVNAFAVSGTNIFASSHGHVFLSTNYGTVWTQTALSSSTVHSLAVLGTSLFAGVWYDIFRSTNNGTNWSAVNTGLTSTWIKSLAVSGTSLFAGTGYGGVFLSTNNGSSWNSASSGLTTSDIRALAVSGTYIFAGTDGGVFRSTNNGATWTSVSTGLTSTWIRTLAGSGTKLFAGVMGGGAYLSTDNGTNWASVNTGLTSTDVRALAISGAHVFAGTAGSSPGVYRSTNYGTSWEDVTTGLSRPQVYALAATDEFLYAGTSNGLYVFAYIDSRWRLVNIVLANSSVQALLLSGTHLFAGTSRGLFLSTDNGSSWATATTGMTNTDIHAIAISGANLFAGTYNGIFRSSDNGTSWTSIGAGLPGTYISALCNSGADIFVATLGSTGGVFRSTDNGSIWSTLGAGLPDNGVTAFAISGTDLFAGTSGSGLFRHSLAGSLEITLRAEDPWGLTGSTGRVELFNNAGDSVAGAQANASSVVTFPSLLAGVEYHYRVYNNKSTPWGEEFWGEKTGITIVEDQTTYDTHTHNTPYMPGVSVFIDSTNELLSDSAMHIVLPGTKMRIELQITNPAYEGAQTVSAYACLFLDRDKTAPYDIRMHSPAQCYDIGSTRTVCFYFNAPAMPGSYYLSVAAFASSGRYDTTLTDASSWHDPAFAVDNSVTLPPWTFTNTGISHTVVIPASAHPNIDGTPLSIGDYVGVFCDSSGILACAGYERWTGTNDMAVSAFGDDPTSSAKDGFIAGEMFRWKIFSASDAKVCDAAAIYAGVGGAVTHTNRYAPDGMSQVASLFGGAISQGRNLRAGWSLVSGYVTPDPAALDSIFKEVLSDVIIVKNGAQKNYIPSVPLNTIGSWKNTEGYQIKMTNARTLWLTGQMIVPAALTIGLPLGWSIMPYVRGSDMPIVSALSGVVGDVVMVKDQDGKTYIPSVGVDGIVSLRKGQAYQIKMASAHTFAYPTKGGAVITADDANATQSVHATTGAPPWFYSNTGVSHTIIIPASVNPAIDGTPLVSGDYVGVFYDSSGTLACAGFEAWSGSTALALAAFGDDPTTPAKDGLAAGELLRWKVWRHSDGHAFVAMASYVAAGGLGGIVTDTSRFTANGISALATLTGSITGMSGVDLPTEYTLMQNYPNPFNPTTFIRFGLPTASVVTLVVYNVLGEEVRTLVNENLAAGFHTVAFDATGCPSGLYFYRMRAGNVVETKKLLLVR